MRILGNGPRAVRIAMLVYLFAAMPWAASCVCESSSSDSGAASDDDQDRDSDDDVDDDTNDDDQSDDDTVDDDTDDDLDDDSAIPDEDLTDYAPAPTNDAGIFVAKEGDDANPGTRASPKKTVQAGADAALLSSKSVFIAQGEYNESVTTQVSLFGGYGFPGWRRGIATQETAIEAANATGLTVVSEYSDPPIVVESLSIAWGGASTGAPYFDTQGVVVANSGSVIFSRDHIHSGIGDGFGTGVLFLEDGVRAVFVRSVVESAGPSLFFGFEVSFAIVNSFMKADVGSGSSMDQSVFFAGTDLSLIFGTYLYGGNATGDTSETFGVRGGIKNPANLWLYNTIVNSGRGDRSVGIYLTASEAGVQGNNIWAPDMDYVYCFGTFGPTCLPDIWMLNLLFGTTTNLSTDPLFVDAEAGDYRLTPTSPCVDGGVGTSDLDDVIAEFDWADLASHIAEDFDGNPRPYGSAWDIGPYEWRP